MSPIDAVVVGLSVALIAGELWFFLGPRRVSSVRPSRTMPQEIKVLVKGGYEPDTITVEAGRPVRLLFYRDETAECSARVIFESLGIEKELPAFQTTAVDFNPEKPGDYPFHCGLSVLHGRVVAQVGSEGARANLGKGHAKHG
ncbi:MAG: cupredoxin domain-containing protein [Gemmatimonadota bacterium]|nr:MAG: cupredoxin domain-containing protein [Gemmatimonadota bacterium]